MKTEELPAAPAPARTRSIGRYRVLSVLGAGGMGEVVRARDDRLGRDVAIKQMRALLGHAPPTFTARFEAEARALAAVTHPGIVQIFDLGADDDAPYLVMELVDGPSLRELLRERGALPAAEVRAAGIQLARALQAAHGRGVLHRDVKPANVLYAPGGVWKLADFGVAHVPDSTMTLTGQFLGTPAYAAPEALTLGQFSEASDVFGLAATLYEAATGVRPRADATLAQLIARSDESVIAADMPPPPAELAGALRAALSIDPHARPSAAAFAEQLAATDGPPAVAAVTVPPPPRPPARPRSRRGLVIAAAIAAAISLVLVLAGGDDAPSPRPFLGAAPAAAPAPAPAPFSLAPAAFTAPPTLDGKGAREWSKVADKVHDGKYRDALHKLVDFERRFGASRESTELRTWLEGAVAAGLDPDDHYDD